jgi:hypothetical protein
MKPGLSACGPRTSSYGSFYVSVSSLQLQPPPAYGVNAPGPQIQWLQSMWFCWQMSSLFGTIVVSTTVTRNRKLKPPMFQYDSCWCVTARNNTRLASNHSKWATQFGERDFAYQFYNTQQCVVLTWTFKASTTTRVSSTLFRNVSWTFRTSVSTHQRDVYAVCYRSTECRPVVQFHADCSRHQCFPTFLLTQRNLLHFPFG